MTEDNQGSQGGQSGATSSRRLAPVALLVVGIVGLAGAIYSRTHKPGASTTPTVAGDPATPATPSTPAYADRAPDPKTPKALPLIPAVDSVASLAEHAGWFGSVVAPGMVLAIAEIPADTSAAAVFRQQYPSAGGFLQVTAHNRTDVTVTIDVARAELVRKDSSGIAVASRRLALMRAAGNSEALIARHGMPYQIPAKDKLTDGVIFLPEGLPMASFVGVAVFVGGQRVVVPGRVYSVEEKKALFKAPEGKP